jgi:ferric-dicitrate binding protein FerR (iron transport regulator)
MSTTAHKVATHAAARTKAAGRRRPPSVLREIAYGMGLGLFAGYLWKLHHWSNQRRTREFYSLLDQGKITVVADEPPPGAGD